MRKLLLLFVVFLLVGCTGKNKELTVKEVDPDNVSSAVDDFIFQIETTENGEDTGIHMYNDSEDRRYLYISQQLLEKETFSGVDVKGEGDTVKIFVNGDSGKPAQKETGGKLYEINLDKDYEVIRIYKNEEETHFESIGL